jgi:hypothetical protein
MDQTYKTEFGDVTLEELLRVYTIHKKANLRHQVARYLVNQTEQGKELNRKRSNEYYHKHKEEILLKRAEEYQRKKAQEETH